MREINPPCIIDMPDDEYNSPDCPGIRSGMIKDYLESPLGYYLKYIKLESPEEEEDAKESNSLTLGSMAHLMLLQQDEFYKKYQYIGELAKHPDMLLNKNTKAYKLALANYEAACEGKTPIIEKDNQTLMRIMESAKANRNIKGFLERSVNERVHYWTHSSSGLICRCKPDCVYKGIMADLKTTWSLNYFRTKAVRTFGYDVQQAHYIDGYESTTGERIESFKYLVIETSWPFDAMIYSLHESQMEEPSIKRNLALNGIAHRMTTGQWRDEEEVVGSDTGEAYRQKIYTKYGERDWI